MSDLLTVQDLEAAKKHDTFHSEVITGKKGGVVGGASIDYATNAVTGQIQKTLPRTLLDIAFVRTGTFAAGATLTDMRQTLEYSGHEYSWAGTFPKVVAAGATPATSGGIGAGAWVDHTDVTLRSDLASESGSGLVGYQPAGNGAVATTVQSKLRETVSVKDFGAVGDGVTDDTAAIQAALDDAIARRDANKTRQALVTIPDGEFLISSTIVHHPRLIVHHEGTLVPDSVNWDPAADAVYTIREDVFDNYDNGWSAYKLADRTAIEGHIKINPGVTSDATGPGPIQSVPAVGIKALGGGNIYIASSTVLGCRKGGIHCLNGGVDLHNFTIVAPPDAERGAQGLYSDTHDGQFSHGLVKFFDIGVALGGTSNVLNDVHVWGWTSVDLWGIYGRMRRGFELQGGFNKLIGCYADTVAKDDPEAPPSYTNGGIGFYSNQWNNSFISCKVKSHEADGTDYGCAFWLEQPQNTLIDCDATDFDEIADGYYIYYSGNASRLNTFVIGGNVGLYSLRDANRNVALNHPDSNFSTRRVKWQIDHDFVNGTFVLDGTINTKTGGYTTDFEITLPDEFSGASGQFIVESPGVFRAAIAGLANFYDIRGVISGTSMKFAMYNLSGGIQYIQLEDLDVGNFYLAGTFTASLEPR